MLRRLRTPAGARALRVTFRINDFSPPPGGEKGVTGVMVWASGRTVARPTQRVEL